jgi:hypothetical protein
MSSPRTFNHWPLMRRQPPSECGVIGDTADPHAAITCPCCRDRLASKVSAHRAESARAKPGSQQSRFFAGDAAHWQAILDRPAALPPRVQQ